MARISQDDFSGQSSDNSGNKIVEIDANGQNSIEVPSNDFIADAAMSREGQSLVLEAPNGDTLVINNYFVAEPAPVIESPDGSVLTSNLVNSFLNSPAQFAQASTMADVSPVGAIEEASGEATVIRADGTSEPITLGTPIYQGDIIETSTDGAVNIVFIDETSMAVSENARLAIDDYQFDPATESGETNLSVLRGVFVYTSGLIGRDDPDDVMIDTPVGSIGIRGTIIAGKIQPGGKSEITVVEGAIVVMNGSSEVTLSQQYETVRLGSFNDNIENMGVKQAGDVGRTYGSVKDVLPKLFSSINDTAKEENKNSEDTQTEEDVQAGEETPTDEVNEQQDAEPENSGDDASVQEALDAFSDILVQSKNGEPEQDNGKSENTEKRSGDYKNFRGEKDDGEIPIFFNDRNNEPEGPSFSFSANSVFENSTIGDLVARISVSNMPAGTTFTITGAGAGDYTGTLNGNVFEVTLNTSVGAVGTSLGAATITATLPDGSTVPWNISPTIADAAIHLNTAGGLQNYDVDTAASTPTAKTFDLDNDGNDDTLVGNAGASGGVGEILLNGSPVTNPAPNTGDNFGQSVEAIGDFDGDGKTDYAVGSPGNDDLNSDDGRVHIMLDGSSTTISGHAAGQMLGNKITGIGDIDGDGLSDILLFAGGDANSAYVVYGGTTGNIDTGTLSTDGFTINTPNNLVAAGGVGDINGDGIDDFAVSLDDGSDINTYVVYGIDGGFSNIDLSYLENPDNALKIKHSGVSGSSYNVVGIGDVNGDGFDDIHLGVTGGSEFVVHGEAEQGSTVVTDDSANDGDASAGSIRATGTSQSLVGDVDFDDNFHVDLSMRGGSSDNTFTVSQQFANIDGGTGFDTVNVVFPLDFSNVNFEQIDQIERLQVGADSTKITLTAENLFNLLKSSDNGELRIESSTFGAGTGRDLEIKASADHADNPSGVVAALDEVGSGATHVGSSGGYDHYQIGGYDLYIDQGLNTTVVV